MAVEFVGIELQLRGKEGVMSDLQKLDGLLKTLRGRKMADVGMQKLRRDIVAARGELEKFQRLRQRYLEAGGKGNAFTKEVQTARNKLKDLLQAQREVTRAQRDMGRTFQQTMNSYSSRIAQMGSSMQTLGNTMLRVTRPFTRVTTGLLYGVGFKLLNMVTEGFHGAFERYDTMNNYAKSLKALGLEADKTFKVFANQDAPMTAIENLNEAVLGLPTGLDEIVAAQKVYAGATGEMVKSTKTAIAANNTFLASGTNAREQRFIQRYLASLASGAELTTTQWQSMSRIAPLAMRAVAEELGYTGKRYQEFIKDVSNGTIAGEEFLNTFIEVGTNGKVQAAANVMKTTWAGLTANIQNATKRMGEGILKALDDAFVSHNGRNFVQNLLGFDAEGNEVGGGIKHWINGISDSVQNWIRANPNKIMDFFNELKKIDIGGFLKGMALGFGDMAKVIRGIVNAVGGENLVNFGRNIIRMRMLGRALLLFGGILRGLRLPLAFFGTLVNWGAKGGLIGRLAHFIGVGGAGSARTIGALGNAAPVLGTVGTGLTAFFKGWLQVATMVGGSALVAWGSMKAFKAAFKDLKEIAEIVGEIDWWNAAGALSGMGSWVVALTGLGNFVGTEGLAGTAIGGLITMVASGAFWADMELIKQGFEAIRDVTLLIDESIGNLSDIGSITGKQATLKKIDSAIQLFNQVTELLEPKRLRKGEETGNMELLGKKSAKSIENLSKSIIGIRDTVKALDEIPPVEDIEGKAKKAEEAISAMQGIYDKLMNADTTEGTDISKGSNKYQRANAEGVINSVSEIISTVKQTISDLEALQELKVNLDDAKQNVVDIGKAMGDIFRTLNNAFGQMVTTDSEAGNWKKVENVGVNETQEKSASKLASLFDSYMQTINSIKQIYQALVGGEGDTGFDLSAFQDVMGKLTGDEGIIPQLKSMYDQLVSEQEGFGAESDVDLSGIMESFSSAIGSIKQAVTTLSEIGQIEFGEDGMSGIVTEITSVIKKLTNTFNADLVASLKEHIDLFVEQMKTLKASIESLGGDGGSIHIVFDISHEIVGGEETVQALNETRDSIKTARDAIKKLSGAINLSFPISVSITGVESAVSRLNSAASRIRAAKANLRSASGGIGVHTGGYIGARGVQYRALGGSIFRPRGTDTVPAMLTPGEYVQNRRAVDFFGIDFMRKVNQLDVRGAMSELMAKAGSMAGASRGTVVNNTYNNNQKVVINGADVSNAGYTFKKASRFVGAL